MIGGRRLRGVVGCALALGCATRGLPVGPVLTPYEHAQWVAPLGSGLRVVVQEDHGAPLVAVVAVYGAGGAHDPPAREGLAHVVEHLTFRARPGGGGSFREALLALGAAFNASTATDSTTYFAVAAKHNLHELMQLEAWRLARTLDGVTPVTFAAEREVVRQEVREGWENAAANPMQDLIRQSLYPAGHPLARAVVGTHASLAAATLDDAQAFVTQHYRPDNCTIVIAGDVSTAEVQRELGAWPAEILFGPGGKTIAPRRTVPAPAAPPPPPVTRELVRRTGPLDQPVLVLGWSTPAVPRALLELAAARLALTLPAALGLGPDDAIERLAVAPSLTKAGGQLLLSAELEPDADPVAARRRLEDALAEAWTTPPAPAEAEASRWRAATRLWLDSDDLVKSAVAVAEHMAATGSTRYFHDSFAALEAVQALAVRDLAFSWLRRERTVAAYFAPESPGLGAAWAADERAQEPAHDPAPADALELDDVQLRRAVPSPALARLPRFRLANGFEIVVMPRGEAPIAHITIGLAGGRATRPYGLAALTDALARSRCARHGDLEVVGGRSSRALGLDRRRIEARVPAGNLANGLAVLADEVTCQELDADAASAQRRWIDLASRDHRHAGARPEREAARALAGALYPGHAYGEAAFADPEGLRALTPADARAFLAHHRRPDQAVAVVFGAVAPDDVHRLGERFFASWTAATSPAAAAEAPPGPPARRLLLIDRPRATQAIVHVGCRLAAPTAARMPAFDVLEALAANEAWQLRADWGATYGIGAQVTTLAGGGAHLVLEGAIDGARAGRAVARLLGLVAQIAAGQVERPRFLTSRAQVGAAFNRRFAAAQATADAILRAAALALPRETWDLYPDNLAATTPDTLRELLRPCAGKEVVTIVGDAARVRPQLEAQGLRPEAL